VRKEDFFFEKKKQKTFAHWLRPLRKSSANFQKFFGSFFQKRTSSFLASIPDNIRIGGRIKNPPYV